MVVIGLGWWSFVRKDAPQTVTPEPEPGVVVTNSPKELKKEKIAEEEMYYRIDAYYPLTESNSINQTFKDFIAEQVLQFKQDTGVENLDPEHARDLGLDTDRKYWLNIDYLPVVSKNTYSYVFTTSIDTGGAHPNTFNKTFVFSEQGFQLTLDTLFKEGSSYLSVISKYAQTELKKAKVSTDEWIAEGAGEDKENFQNFVMTDAGIQFVFDPYQVAPYAAGEQMVTVPYSVLKNLLRPQYVR